MNPKNALFLAATLTAFVLATLFALVNKVTTTPIEAAAAPAVQNTATTAVLPTDLPSATAQTELGPMEAAKIAADSIGRTDIYSVESFTYKTQNTFKVVFSSGDVVYVGLNREIVDTAKLQSVVVSGGSSAPTKPSKKNSGGGGGSVSSHVQPPAPKVTQPPVVEPQDPEGNG